MKNKLPVALSNRHVHLNKEDAYKLFGEGYELTVLKDLSQPGQYACNEKIDLIGPKGVIKGIRVLGPYRDETQIELSLTDARKIGLNPPVVESGKLENSPGAKVMGPIGDIELKRGVIIAARHIHFSEKVAKEFGVKDSDVVKARTSGERALTFENVLIRVSSKYELEMHIDIDEGNAAGLSNGDIVELIK